VVSLEPLVEDFFLIILVPPSQMRLRYDMYDAYVESNMTLLCPGPFLC
jgi:hypothetical protein